MIHTSSTRVAYAAEAAYASGKGTLKYAATAFVAGDVASLTVMNTQKANIQMGVIEAERLTIKSPTMTPDGKHIQTQGYRYKEFKLEQYIQNETFAILAAATLTAGTLQSSLVFHFEVPGVSAAIDAFDVIGCVVKEYEIDQNEGDFPTERITFTYYDVINSAIVTNLASWSTATAANHKDIALTLFSLSITDLIKSTLKITIEHYDKKVATKYQRGDPIPISRDIELDATFNTDTAALTGDSLALGGTPTAINEVAIAYTYISTSANISASKMYVDSENIGEIPDKIGVYEHNIKMKMGAACAVAHNT